MQEHKTDKEIKNVFPTWVWLVYMVLFVCSIPWYFSNESGIELVFGLPIWLIISVFMILGIAVFTLVILSKYWKEN